MAAAWRDPDLSLCLLMFSLPFDRLFHVGEQSGLVLLGIEILAQVSSEVGHRRFDPRKLGRPAFWMDGLRTATWPLIAVYVLLAVAYVHPDVAGLFRAKTAAFGAAALALLICCDGRLDDRSCRSIAIGIVAGALLQLVVDLAFLAGWRWLFLAPETLPYDPVVSGRLMGLTLNANFLADVLLAAFCLVYTSLLLGPRRGMLGKVLLLGILYSGVAQTVSKGPVIASLLVLFAAFCVQLLNGHRARAWLTAGVAASCVALVLVNVVLPTLYIAWAAPSPARAAQITPGGSVPPSPIERRLRVRVETPAVADIDRKQVTQGRDVTCSVICAGNRTRLWSAGIEIVREHWLTGFGFGGWKYLMQPQLRYPFTSPHNATLHLWGMFGLVGLALNLGLYAIILRRLFAAHGLWATAAGLYLAMIILGEAVETTLLLSLSRFGLFTWMLLAMQASATGRAAPGTTPPGR